MKTNEEKYEELKNNDSFCLAPWVHIHSLPSGSMQPCCIWDYGTHQENPSRFGNINKSPSITHLMNGDEFKKLRKKFLNGEKEAGCTRCYDRRLYSPGDIDTSMRGWMNKFFQSDDIIDNVLGTNLDGSVDELQIRYLDIRFGNICNLKCRMCGHGLSSSWYEEHLEIYGRSGPNDDGKFIHSDCFDKILPYLPYVTEIYFAGGEPMLYPEHLKILDKLIEIGNTDLSIKYNSNLTSLVYKKRNIIDVLKEFKHVYIGASIDDMGNVVEYIRTGLDWEKFKTNFETIRREAPHITVHASPTIGILNIESYIEFHKFCFKNKWLNPQATFNYITAPEEMNILSMPMFYKEQMIELYQSYIETLNESFPNISTFALEELVERLKVGCDDKTVDIEMKKLYNKLNTFDNTAKLDWKKSLPHVAAMLSTYFGEEL